MSTIGKRNIDTLSNIFLALFFLVYFAIPKSTSFIVPGDFRLIPEYLTPWYIQRYALLLLVFAYFSYYLLIKQIKVNKTAIQTIFWFGVFVCFQMLYEDFVSFYAYLAAASAYILLLNLNNKVIGESTLRLLFLFCFLYVLQFCFYRIGVRITSSFLDPNISGYYLFLCYLIFRTSKKYFLSTTALLAGALTLSRNFYLAVFLYEVVNLEYIENFLKNTLFLNSVLKITILSIITVSAASYYIVNSDNYNITIGSTYERLTNLNDGSNYSRAKANIVMLERLGEGDFIFRGQGTGMDANSEHRPHNAFFRAIYRYGLFIALLSIGFFIYCANLFLNYNYAIVISLFSYYSILNDFVTGNELILFVLVNFVCLSIKNHQTNEKSTLSSNNNPRLSSL
ncbi:hypothetical protein [Endozoicomonas sp. SESOKO1]|uniref:hypothetical protein n=1 Tax=Endozoicomonas sp. SESOKO1 TaxID=2828742 RepID=UPI002148E7B7|nr:hypothetical protein [Endozoicomonas sp. SESOKO1]